MSGFVASQAKPTAAARFLLLAATVMELTPLRETLRQTTSDDQQAVSRLDFLCCGVGLTATAATLAGYLASQPDRCRDYAGVILGGVAGAYPVPADLLETANEQTDEPPKPAEILDICLADREVLGDFGIATIHVADPFTHPDLVAAHEFSLDTPLASAAKTILRQLKIPFHSGTFITVNATTATSARALALARRHQGLCENMEGAAAAYVCQQYRLPLLEIRCISNKVGTRDFKRWRLSDAIKRNSEIIAQLLPKLALAVIVAK